MRKMNREKAIVSQGMPTFNTGLSSDPKPPSRILNGKPEFRIRKRNESAKVKIGKNSTMRKHKTSFKESSQTRIDTIAPDEEAPTDPYKNHPPSHTKRVNDLSSQQIISKMQVKYGMRTSLPPHSRTKKRRTVQGSVLSKGLKKAYSNKPPEMMEPILKMGSLKEKSFKERSFKEKGSKVPLKEKFINHNKLPEITGKKNLLPKIN